VDPIWKLIAVKHTKDNAGRAADLNNPGFPALDSANVLNAQQGGKAGL
jgi:hypothetical protein